MNIASECKHEPIQTKKLKSSDALDPHVPERVGDDGEGFRAEVTKFYLRNALSAKQTATLIKAAHKSGATDVADMSAIGQTSTSKNQQRDLMRKILKGVKFPEPYYANIPVRDRNTGKRTTALLPFLLVHEVLVHIMVAFGRGFGDILKISPGGLKDMKDDWVKTHSIPHGSLVAPIGMHWDGVPFGDKDTMEVASWNLCSVPGSERNLFGCVTKKDLCDCGCSGRCTIDSILEMFRWCMLSLLVGKYPAKRHDNTDWQKTDKIRSQKAKQELGIVGGLFEFRGDWMMFKQVLGIKGWASSQVCWRCFANKTDIPYWDPSLGSKWSKMRKSFADFSREILDAGHQLSPLFSIPGFGVKNICIDVLHALDLGLSQDIVGNVLYESLGPYAIGRNKTLQLEDLMRKLKNHYSRMKTNNRIDKLTMDMIRKTGKAPKLRARGAETRYIIPFALEIAIAMVAANVGEHWRKTHACVSALMDFSMCLGLQPFPLEKAKDALMNACSHYVDLAVKALRQNKNAWRMKPKIHLVMELALFQMDELSDPMTYWCYKDENFVGLVADIGAIRGGGGSAATSPKRIVERMRVLAK